MQIKPLFLNTYFIQNKASFGSIYEAQDDDNSKDAEKLININKILLSRTANDYDIFQKNIEDIDETYEKNRLEILKSWFPHMKLAKLDLFHSGQKDALNRSFEAFINEKNKHIEDLEIAMRSLEIAGRTLDELNKLKSTYHALIEARDEAIRQQQTNLGLNKIAGYETEKNFFQKVFINEVNNERHKLDADVPNGILLFGPTGCGKTKMVHALAETLYPDFEKRKIYFKDIKTYEEPEQIFEQLEKVMEDAKENFKNENKRTLILLDEFEAFAGKEQEFEVIEGIKAILSDADDSYCTFFMTTNYPSEIHPDTISTNRIKYAVSVDPPNRENLIAVARHYFSDLNIPDINYDEIADLMLKSDNKGFFSNSGIEYIANQCKGGNINFTILKKIIESSEPNVTPEAYQEYLEEKKIFETIGSY